MSRSFGVAILVCLSISACKYNTNKTQSVPLSDVVSQDTVIAPSLQDIWQVPEGWEALTEDEGFVLDIRYATTNNFTKAQIYPCGACYLRSPLALAIRTANVTLNEKYGYRLKLFDCYRPAPAQQKLWDIVPDPRYVTNPQKGSMHNRGMAVDITIVDADDNELDMGTPYDHFEKEAHYDFMDLEEDVIQNRRLLRAIMEENNCKGIRTEWWHFSLPTPTYPVENWEWPCPDT